MILTDCGCCQGERDSEATGGQEQNWRCTLWIGDIEWKNRLKEKYRTTVTRDWSDNSENTGWEGNSPSVVPLSWIQKWQRTIKRTWFNSIVKWWDKCRVCRTEVPLQLWHTFSSGSTSRLRFPTSWEVWRVWTNWGTTDDRHTIKTRVKLPRWVVTFPLLLYRQTFKTPI